MEGYLAVCHVGFSLSGAFFAAWRGFRQVVR
jgi:hypothetical protein